MAPRRPEVDTDPAATRPAPLPTFDDSCLVVLEGPRLGDAMVLGEAPVVIGRSARAGFHLEHPSVSREHCEVREEVLGASIRDLGSKNGVLVNGMRVRSAMLSDGDLVLLGDVLLKFVAGGSQEAKYHHALYGLASVDGLTQLLTRRAFRERVDEAVARAGGLTNAQLSFVIFDLDHFKQINDLMGHDAGDAALRLVSATLRGQLRAHDVGGRLGGDEFAVLMPDADAVEAGRWCEGLRAAMEGLGLESSGLPQRVSISVGHASWAPNMRDAQELMRRADQALLRAKAAGRNCVRAAIMGE